MKREGLSLSQAKGQLYSHLLNIPPDEITFEDINLMYVLSINSQIQKVLEDRKV